MLEYSYLLIFLLISILISLIVFLLSFILGNQSYDTEKLSAYGPNGWS